MHSHSHSCCTRSTALQGLVVLEPVRQADEAPVPDSCEGIVGRSPALLGALRAVSQVAPTQATVLITGESGTGKELIARAIHRNSRRRDGPLVKVNCAAVPAALIESEFFGHERGAFTGATGRREGRFMLADGGTIFLDEVAELRLELQAKLLRVLQEGEFEPVGTSRTRRVNVRVVAATNRDLQAEVRAGRFRGDLYFRLKVVSIHLPPLRERGDDVLMLGRHFLREFARKFQKRFGDLAPAAAQMLRDYAWPGNVRELRNLIERVVLLEEGQRLLPDHLPAEFTGRKPAPGEAPAAPKDALGLPTLAQMEAEHIGEVLRLTAGNKSRAARILGISRQGLIEKLRRLRMDESAGRQVS